MTKRILELKLKINIDGAKKIRQKITEHKRRIAKLESELELYERNINKLNCKIREVRS